jgi:hypothetical protein
MIQELVEEGSHKTIAMVDEYNHKNHQDALEETFMRT